MLTKASKRLISLLEPYGNIDKNLYDIINRGSIRTLEAKMIIENSYCSDRAFPTKTTKKKLITLSQSDLLESTLNNIRSNGLGPHFRELMQILGKVMLLIAGDDAQKQKIAQWNQQGLVGAFLVTDKGGPSISQWLSEATFDDRNSGAVNLSVNKVHGIDGHIMDFGIVSFRNRKSFAPAMLLIPPQQCQTLSRTPIGEAFLDGHVQLGNVKGDMVVDQSNHLRLGGMSAVNQYFAINRPRFIRALLAHIQWLCSQDRAKPDDTLCKAINQLDIITKKLTDREYYTGTSVDEVLAAKFASNEILLELVTSNSIPNEKDQRDLLGFSKMEGSSYRCYFEIMSKLSFP
jgi:hypothetical protein